MNRHSYFKFLNETSILIHPILKDITSRFIGKEQAFHEFYSKLILKRVGKQLLKPTLFRVVYELFGGNNFESYLNIAASFELINISSYQSNSAFDNKLSTLTKEEKDSQFISSMISREIANELILKDDIDTRVKNTILKKITEINYNIYLAQHYDLNMLSINNYSIYKENEELFNRDYEYRCYLGSGFFSGACAYCAAIIAGASEQESRYIMKIAEIYGTALHKLNDIGDYLPELKQPNKIYQDDYCDLKNGRLTMPLYITLKENPSLLNSIKNDVHEENLTEYIIAVRNNLDNIILSIKKDYKQVKYLSKTLPTKSIRNLFMALCSSLDSNKYYYRLKTLQNVDSYELLMTQ